MDRQIKPLKALVADDDPIFLSLVRSCLNAAGNEAECVSDGVAALEALNATPFDVAIIDLAMPRVDGFRLIAFIRATPKLEDLPIIVLSARNDVEAVEEAYRLGANAFETKPVNWALFPSHMRHIVRCNSAYVELKRQVAARAATSPIAKATERY